MRNLKKAMALSVVLAMVLTLFVGIVPTSAAADYSAAVERANRFGIIQGYANGDLGAGDSITRAQFATMLVRILGFNSAVISGATTFNDVPATHWASGYVKAATQLGIIKGRGDGSFSPEAPVTLIEALAMVERSMGYELLAVERGGWPTGYVTVAVDKSLDIRLLKDINEPLTVNATRGLICKLLDNSLEKPFWTLDQYDSKGVAYYHQDWNTTFLVKMGYLKVNDAMVSRTPLYGLDPKKVTLCDDTTKGSISVDDKDTFDVVDGVTSDLDSFMGKRVTVYMDEDEKIVSLQADEKSKIIDVKELNDVEVGKVKIKDSADKETTYDRVGEENRGYYDAGNVFHKYTPELGVVVNYQDLESSNDLTDLIGAATVLGDANNLREVKAAIYDGKVDFIFGYVFAEPFFATGNSNNTTSKRVTINAGSNTVYLQNGDDKASRVTILKDGASIASTAVQEDDVIYVASKTNYHDSDNADIKDNKLYIKVVRNTVSGKVNATKTNTDGDLTDAKIGDTYYGISDYADDVSDIAIDETVKAYLDKDGKILRAELDAVNTAKYALVLDLAANAAGGDFGTKTGKMKLLLSDGTKPTYDVDGDLIVDAAPDYINARNFADDDDVALTPNVSEGTLIRFTLDGTTIKKIYASEYDAAVAALNTDIGVNADNKSIDGDPVKDGAALFNITARLGAGGRTDVDAEVVNWANVKTGTDYDVYALRYDNKLNVEAAVFDNASFKGDFIYGYVTSKENIKDGDANYTMLIKDAASTYEYENDADNADMAKGDFVQFKLANGKMSDVTFAAEGEDVAGADNMATVTEGTIEKATSTYIKDTDGNYYYITADTMILYDTERNGSDVETWTKGDLGDGQDFDVMYLSKDGIKKSMII